MSRCHNNIIKLIDSILVLDHVSISNLKLRYFVQILDVSCHAVKFNVLSESFLFKPLQKVALEDLSGHIGWHRLAKVLLEGVIWKLKSFLRQIGPKLTVHAGMHVFAILVSRRPP